MSLNDYNRHATLGPMAGPATSAAAAAGQAAYQRAHERPRESGAGGGNAEMPGLRASLLMLALFGGIFVASVAMGLFVLPETGIAATIAAGAALLSGLGFVIFGVIVGIEAVKHALAWLIFGGAEIGLGWALGAAVVAFVFAAIHFYALGPLSEWMVALIAAALTLVARWVRVLRPLAAAVATGAVAYVLIASHVYEHHSLTAALIAGAAGLVVLAAGHAAQARRRHS